LNWKLEKDLTEVPNGSARLCELCENFAPFAVKLCILQIPKTEQKKQI